MKRYFPIGNRKSEIAMDVGGAPPVRTCIQSGSPSLNFIIPITLEVYSSGHETHERSPSLSIVL
ncbi:MAG: hypothetical protein WBM24_16555, partial [Candidatus Sulfotelmatobacter sp.]